MKIITMNNLIKSYHPGVSSHDNAKVLGVINLFGGFYAFGLVT